MDYKKLHLRLKQELHNKIEKRAYNNERSVNGEVSYLLAYAINSLEESKQDEDNKSFLCGK